MGQFSVEKPELPGSVLSGNQQADHRAAHEHALGQTLRRKWSLKRGRPASGNDPVEKACKRRRIRYSDRPDKHDYFHLQVFVLETLPSGADRWKAVLSGAETKKPRGRGARVSEATSRRRLRAYSK